MPSRRPRVHAACAALFVLVAGCAPEERGPRSRLVRTLHARGEASFLRVTWKEKPLLPVRVGGIRVRFVPLGRHGHYSFHRGVLSVPSGPVAGGGAAG